MIPGNTSRDNGLGRADEECNVKQVTSAATRAQLGTWMPCGTYPGVSHLQGGTPTSPCGWRPSSGGTLTHPELKPETTFQQREEAVCSKKPLAESDCLGYLGSRRASYTSCDRKADTVHAQSGGSVTACSINVVK